MSWHFPLPSQAQATVSNTREPSGYFDNLPLPSPSASPLARPYPQRPTFQSCFSSFNSGSHNELSVSTPRLQEPSINRPSRPTLRSSFSSFNTGSAEICPARPASQPFSSFNTEPSALRSPANENFSSNGWTVAQQLREDTLDHWEVTHILPGDKSSPRPSISPTQSLRPIPSPLQTRNRDLQRNRSGLRSSFRETYLNPVQHSASVFKPSLLRHSSQCSVGSGGSGYFDHQDPFPASDFNSHHKPISPGVC